MNKIEQVSQAIQQALHLIHVSRHENDLPVSGPMSHSQLNEFDNALKGLQKKTEEIRLHRKTDLYEPWIARVIADSWPVNELGEQIMKAEREYLELQGDI